MVDITSDDVREMIRNRYEGSDHVVLFEVPDATGFGQGRWIDATVFSLWPSKGLTRAAIEIKVCRGDFIRELQNPAKYKWCQEDFHEFWYAGPEACFQVDELPLGAGLMVVRGGKLVIKKHAAHNPSPKLDDKLLAAFMRAADKRIKAAVSISEKDLLDKSKDFKYMRMYHDAVLKFLELRNHIPSSVRETTVDDLVGELQKAAGNNALEQDRQHLLNVTGEFQHRIALLFKLFAAIAYKSILARDEHGKYVVSYWGGTDESLMSELRKKKFGRDDSGVIDTIMSMFKETVEK